MMNFYQISTLLAEGGGIGLNTDILETGVLNILALIVILFLFAKENLFNVLNNYIDFEGTTVLDLFAGTGSISIELVSRGCERVISV